MKTLYLILLLLLSVIFCCGLGSLNKFIEGMENNNDANKNITGIPKSQIPPGQEDLYVLKTQIVTPTCPSCPVCNKPDNTTDNTTNNITNNITNAKCPPCPPCARCPESSFECVKKPVYKPENQYLPVPVLTSFSSFGM